MQKILIDAPAWVGDMVMSQVLMRLLKQQQPECQIDVMAPTWTAPILGCMPEIDNVLLTPFKHGDLALRKRHQFAQSIRGEGYDQAIMLRNSFKSALIPFFARIPKRTGWLGEKRYGLLNDIRHLDKIKYPLMIERFAALGLPKQSELPAELPKPFLSLCKQEQQHIRSRLEIDTTQPVLVLCPGAEYGPSKQWPADHFAQVAVKLLAGGYQVWIMGSNKDYVIADKINELTGHQCQNFAGKTSLLEAIHLLDLASVVLTNDSGLMHVAAALQKPLVAVYGGSSPKFTPPLTDRKQLLQTNLSCQPCFKRTCQFGHYQCLTDISAENAIKAINTVSEVVHATNVS